MPHAWRINKILSLRLPEVPDQHPSWRFQHLCVTTLNSLECSEAGHQRRGLLNWSQGTRWTPESAVISGIKEITFRRACPGYSLSYARVYDCLS